jgi:hypothetical protein
MTPTIMSAVLASGCLSSNSIFNSDHRAYFLDLDPIILFSDPAYEIARPVYRQLRLHDPRLIDRYRTALHNHLKQHKIIDKLEDLTTAIAENKWQDKNTTLYNSLDASITEFMLHAERNTGKSFSKQFEWSPKLKQAVQAFRYWKLRLKFTRGRFVSNSRLETHRLAALLPENADLTESQIVTALQAASKELKELQRQHKTLRSTYLEDCSFPSSQSRL